MAEDLTQVSLDRLESDIAYLAMEIERCMARWLDLVAEFDRREGAKAAGFRSTSEWLAWRCGLDLRTARSHVRVARRLEEWPEMRMAYAEGRLSFSKLRALARADADADRVALIELAQRSDAASLERCVRSLRTAPSADLDVARAAHEKRYLEWHWDTDGSLRVHGRLGPDEGAAWVEALEAAAEALYPPPPLSPEGAETEVAVPRPPLAARRADALTEVFHSAAPRAQVVLHVDLEALACTATGDEPKAGGVCGLEDGPAIPSETARRLACDAEAVSDEGRRRRVVSPALRTSPERRDRRCRFPGCLRRHGLHAHHVQHWGQGGPTDRDNLVLLCRFHHRLVHEEAFTVVARNGDFEFRRPDGRHIGLVPPPWTPADRAPPDLAAAA